MIGSLLELLVNTGGIGVGGIIDNTDGSAQIVLGNVVGRADALVGVGKADLEDVVTGGNDGYIGSGGAHHEHPVSCTLSSGGCGRAGGGGAGHDLHTPVHQGGVSVDSLLSVSFVVLGIDLKLQAALGIDLLKSQLQAVGNGIAVHSVAAGQGAAGANLDHSGGFLFPFLGGAADKHGSCHTCGHYKCKYLLHKNLPFIFHL